MIRQSNGHLGEGLAKNRKRLSLRCFGPRAALSIKASVDCCLWSRLLLIISSFREAGGGRSSTVINGSSRSGTVLRLASEINLTGPLGVGVSPQATAGRVRCSRD